MAASEGDSFTFTDADSGDEGWIGVRRAGDSIGLSSSLRKNGDIEVFMPADVARAVAAALNEAASPVSGE